MFSGGVLCFMKFLIGEPDFLWSANKCVHRIIPNDTVSYRMTRDLTNYPTYTEYRKKKREANQARPAGTLPGTDLENPNRLATHSSKLKPFLSPGVVLLALLPFTDPYIMNTTTLLQPCSKPKCGFYNMSPCAFLGKHLHKHLATKSSNTSSVDRIEVYIRSIVYVI